MRALDGVSTRSLAGFGCGSLCRGPLRLDSRMGTDQGVYPWVSTGDGKLDGETFLGRTWMFFSWGEGGGEEKAPGQVLLSRFSQDDSRFQTAPYIYIY